MTLFNSRNSIHRSPLGAVADGTRVHFKITLPRNMQCSASYLLVQHPDNRIECLDMFWCGMNGNDYEWWECTLRRRKRGFTSIILSCAHRAGALSLKRTSAARRAPVHVKTGS